LSQRWTDEDVQWFRENYPIYGVDYCAEQLNRTKSAIFNKAFEIGLFSGSGKRKLKQRRIICRLGDNRVLVQCKRHGKTVHYDWSGKSLRCSKCAQEYYKQWRKTEKGKILRNESCNKRRRDPLVNYADRLRNRLNHCYRCKSIYKRQGCFRHLSYSPQQLYDHLEKIRAIQQNKCPVCGINYDDQDFTIDHIIPLATAINEMEILKLFDLDNLSLLCLSCNSAKGSKVLIGG